MKWLYKITNTVNSKVYIGVSINPVRRWKQHQTSNTQCSALKSAINKHGVDNFTFTKLVCGGDEYIDDLEVKAINMYKTLAPHGYNLTLGGDGVVKYFWEESWTKLLGTMLDKELAIKLGVTVDVIGYRREAGEIPRYVKIPDSLWVHEIGKVSNKLISEKYGISTSKVQAKRIELKLPLYGKKENNTTKIIPEVYLAVGNISDTKLSKLTGITASRIRTLRRKLDKDKQKHE